MNSNLAKNISLLLLMIVLPVWAANDQTKTSSATLIRIEVVNGCLLNNTSTNGLSLGALNFGNIYATTAPLNANTATGSGSIQLRCTPGTTAKITIGAGLYGTGVNDRKMRLGVGTSTLNYQLYTSAARSTVWDDVTGVSILLSDDTTRTFPVYGRIPVQATPANGNYSDQVLVTLSY
ncbi:Csu type fimbrial protein [Cellvibrio mixtus]|uniref:Csu type fimbrial protein n=1 Tax=Cellvibrio mixtus TaxID=39650 RepID=UPI00069347EC|nr:spore coat U domain-containing protein [Cellvibrio mixtus]